MHNPCMGKKKKPAFDASTAFRCWQEQLDRWQKAADAAERELADWMRRTLDDAARLQVPERK